MAAVNFQLRGYQTAALNALRAYLRRVNRFAEEDNPAQAAFQVQTNSPYATAPEAMQGAVAAALLVYVSVGALERAERSASHQPGTS